MNAVHYKYMAAVAAFMVALGFLAVALQTPEEAVGSVRVGDSYQSTTTPNVGDATLLCTGPSVLGSVIYTGPVVNGLLQIIDATTTDVVNGNDARQSTSTLLMADFPVLIAGDATTTPGTYTFDTQAKNGLIIASEGGTVPTTTISYRCNE